MEYGFSYEKGRSVVPKSWHQKLAYLNWFFIVANVPVQEYQHFIFYWNKKRGASLGTSFREVF